MLSIFTPLRHRGEWSFNSRYSSPQR